MRGSPGISGALGYYHYTSPCYCQCCKTEPSRVYAFSESSVQFTSTNTEERIQTAALKLTLVVAIFVSVSSTTVVSRFCYFVPVLLLSTRSVPKGS